MPRFSCYCNRAGPSCSGLGGLSRFLYVPTFITFPLRRIHLASWYPDFVDSSFSPSHSGFSFRCSSLSIGVISFLILINSMRGSWLFFTFGAFLISLILSIKVGTVIRKGRGFSLVALNFPNLRVYITSIPIHISSRTAEALALSS